MFDFREEHIKHTGYVRITDGLCSYLASFGPWVEIGAGTGALSRGIIQQGGRSLATDLHDWGMFDFGYWSRKHTIHADARRVARLVSRCPTLGLLSAWPSYSEPWCFEAVRLLRPGQRFAYIGEGRGGCTGDDQLHDLLSSDFDVIGERDVEQFYGIHDSLVVYRRRLEKKDD